MADLAQPIRASARNKNQSLPTEKPKRLLNPQLVIALLAVLVYHGGLSLYGTYQNTYDAYVHIFFADHWTRGWFDHWDPRWYTGFTMMSYPPLSQQSVAALSKVTGDLEMAFAIVQTSALAVMTIGMYRFAKIWVSEEAAGWAALWLVFSTAMAETVHVFGQLPTTYSLGLLLNALPFAYRWVDEGKFSYLLKAWALTAATTGAHHVTTLFGAVFITAPVIVLALVENFRTPLADEPPNQPRYITGANWRALIVRRLRRMIGPITRSGIYAVGTVVLLLLVVFPYWAWSRSDPITQVAIPHSSRDNFLINRNAGLVFWLIPYGLLIFVFPYVYYRGLFSKTWPLLASIALLMLLGTGGTTPIPRMLLGGAFDILTLDRFTLWASILMLPLAGEFVVSLLHGDIAAWLREQFGDLTWRSLQFFFVVGMLSASLLTVSLTRFRRFQPARIDPTPIVNFMEKDQHDRWRYMTLGFGDQMAWLSAQMTAAQVDGNYHSARRLPEMTTTPVERLEGAKFRGIPGIGSLQQFLAMPDKFNLKYIFSNDQFYDPLLYFYGWHRIQFLENGIAVWEREDIPVLPEELPRREIPLYHRVMFGTLPPTALFLALLATTVQFWTIPFKLLGEILGVTALLRRLPRPRSTPLHRIYGMLDTRLLAASQMPYQESAQAPPWQIWLRWMMRRSRRRIRPSNLRSRHIRAAMLAITVMVLIGVGAAWINSLRSDPVLLVEHYYDDLDFRRFGDAYDKLNPHTRPDYEQFLLNLTATGGLVASYAKLEDMRTTVLVEEPHYMEVQTDTRYITALSYYTDTATLTLTRGDDYDWAIEPPPVDVTVPPGQFIRQPTVGFLSQGRSRVTSDTTSFADVLDRPELAVLDSRLVADEEGRFSVVGEVMNIDVDPADLTVTARLYDQEGAELTVYNATSAMLHKLLPQEITPFRVDFEGVAGLALEDTAESLSFRPDARWDYELPPDAELGAFNVFAKAVVTGRDLERNLGIQDMVVKMENGGLRLDGTIINSGLTEGVIPHVLLTLYDQEGRIVWVDDHFIRESVRPQRALDISLPIRWREDIGLIDLPGSAYANSLRDSPVKPGPREDFVELPPESGYSYLRVSIHSYGGGSR